MDQQSWRLRLRAEPVGGEPGDVLGAGVLLGRDLVLTCAHVVPGPTEPVRVEFPVLTGGPNGVSRSARVVEGHWVERYGRDEGDLALLRLTEPAPVTSTAVLHRDPVPYDTRVTVDGFPRHRSGGLWVDALLKGPGGHGDEWVQINPVDFHDPDPRGFSGAGVAEAGTGRLLGIMVAVYDTPADRSPFFHFYMIPAATIAGHLPLVAEHHMTGPRVIPPQLSVAPGDQRTGRPLGLQQTLTCWLNGDDGSWDIETVFLREDDKEADVALRTTLGLADRERSPGLSTTASSRPGGPAVPRRGSISLAVAAAGRSRDQLARDLESQPPRQLTSVVVSLPDRAAADPGETAGLLRRLAGRGARLLLVLHGPAPVLTGELLPAGRAAQWLERLADRADRLSGTERTVRDLFRRLEPRVTGLPAPPARHGARAQLWTTQLAAELERTREQEGVPSGSEADVAALLQMLSYAEQSVLGALLRAEDVEQRLRAALDRMLDLRGLLAAEQARLADHQRAEDAVAVDQYRRAQQLLTEGPSSLDDVERAVTAFVRTVHARLDGGPGPEGAPRPGDGGDRGDSHSDDSRSDDGDSDDGDSDDGDDGTAAAAAAGEERTR
ncbi:MULTISPECIES: trypsin-like peptidase domain-containing protein [unclassified Streptomyces]|uniref:trypsin-like peptidase domain-containing protein n=1 Tax=unclassified Streptomyces TaxID=2593676 RepID=UPI002E236C13|nr:trypsin-like peptidase domain-containing protein [Streptomyces sp. NBC_01023]